MNIKDVYFGKVKFFLDVHERMVFLLTSSVQFNIWAFSDYRGLLCLHVVKKKMGTIYTLQMQGG